MLSVVVGVAEVSEGSGVVDVVLFVLVALASFVLISRALARRIEPLFLGIQGQIQAKQLPLAIQGLEGLLPMSRWQILLAGQIHGGVVQGVGQALTEDTVYSEDGQLLTATFMDYAMPRAELMPMIHFETRNVPSTTNALGMKGAGEAGTVGSTPAALNAVTDALWRAYGIRHIEMPATPARIWAAIQAA